MAVHFTGPILETVRVDSPRGVFANLPVGLGDRTDFIDLKEDFLYALDTTNDWLVVKDSGASVANAGDALGGILNLNSTATTSGDGACIQMVNENWQLAPGKEFWFETSINSANNIATHNIFVGMCVSTVATNPEDVLATADYIGFQVTSGSAVVSAIARKNSTNTTIATPVSMVSGTFYKLGFYFNGGTVGSGATVAFYVNRAYVGTISSANIPDDEILAPTMYSLSGSATGTRQLQVDYIQSIGAR